MYFLYFYLFTMSLFFGYQLRFSFSFRIIFWLVRWVLVVFACIWGTYYLSLFNHNAFKFRHSYKDQFEMIEDPLFWNQVVFYAFHPILLLTHLINLWSIRLSLDYPYWYALNSQANIVKRGGLPSPAGCNKWQINYLYILVLPKILLILHQKFSKCYTSKIFPLVWLFKVLIKNV